MVVGGGGGGFGGEWQAGGGGGGGGEEFVFSIAERFFSFAGKGYLPLLLHDSHRPAVRRKRWERKTGMHQDVSLAINGSTVWVIC